MTEDYVILAIPGFFLLMAIEYGAVRLRRHDYYRLGDALNSISCGIIARLMDALVGLGPGMALYAFVGRLAYKRLDPASASTWILAFLCVDFLYYWWHRYCHEINFMWAGHIVHHQSEEYNLSTALRQSWPTSVTGAIFFLPTAMLGVPFEVYFAATGVNLLYQFWIHTRLIGKMGPLEWVFNTPSHHRVHHGVNPEYVDKNYGGILIIWDRLFGTFAEERAPVIFGTVKPLHTWNPIHNNLGYWIELGRRSLRASGLRARLLPWLVSPEWTLEDPHPPLVLKSYRPADYRKFDVELTRPQMIYAVSLFVLILASSAVFLNFQQHLPAWCKVVFLLVNVAGLTHVASVGRPKAAMNSLRST